MKYNNDWVYRNIYECDILLNICTNEIMCISSTLAELFDNNDFDETFSLWVKKHDLSNETKNDVLGLLIKKGIIYEQTI